MKLNCPICGKEADSPHHVKPRSQGGLDEERNIIYLCKPCHDAVEMVQEERNVKLSPNLIEEMRLSLRIKLDEVDGISESYLHRDGKSFLMWIILQGKTKTHINQYVDGEPDNIPSTALDEIMPNITPQKPRYTRPGRPANNNIDSTYLLELLENKGLSLRSAQRYLRNRGFSVSHEFIRKRTVGLRIIQRTQCKQCGKEFTPEGTRRIFCSVGCYKLHERKS